MRADRMRVSINGALDSAYAALARLKVAFPIAQAAAIESEGRVNVGLVLTLIDLTRDLADRVSASCMSKILQLDFDRRSRVLRSVAQETAYLVGRASERNEPIDASRLVEHVRIAIDAVQSIPGAKVSLPYAETLGSQVRWELAISSAAARLTESMMDDPGFCSSNIKSLLSGLLDRVGMAANEIKTSNDEERLTVRVSLLTNFSKGHARLISRTISRESEAGRAPSLSAVLRKLDAYHAALGMAMLALEAPVESTPNSPAPTDEVGMFSPEI